MRLAALLSIAALVNAPCLLAGDIDGDIHSSVEPDLTTPPATPHAPAPGKRVRQVNKNYATTQVHHLLYLPTDWVKGKKYPVIVEHTDTWVLRDIAERKLLRDWFKHVLKEGN
jgi:hypothetical protein